MKTLTQNGKRTIILGVTLLLVVTGIHVGIFIGAMDQIGWLIWIDSQIITAIIFFLTGTVIEARKNSD